MQPENLQMFSSELQFFLQPYNFYTSNNVQYTVYKLLHCNDFHGRIKHIKCMFYSIVEGLLQQILEYSYWNLWSL